MIMITCARKIVKNRAWFEPRAAVRTETRADSFAAGVDLEEVESGDAPLRRSRRAAASACETCGRENIIRENNTLF